MNKRIQWTAMFAVFASVLSGTVLIPAARPLLAARGNEDAMHVFFGLNMLGAAMGAPLFAWLADRTGERIAVAGALALVDAALLSACTTPLPVSTLLALRALQGACNVGALSILMGEASRGQTPTARNEASGMMGASVIAAITLGSPLGSLLLHRGATFAFWAAAFSALGVALATLGLEAAPAASADEKMRPQTLLAQAPQLAVPTAWIAIERFTIGCFVVTFAMHAHHTLRLQDSDVGMLFAAMLVPFAIGTWVFGKLVTSRTRLFFVVCGTFAYGVGIASLGATGPSATYAALALAGVGSAAIYGPSLSFVTHLAPREQRATAMAFVNAFSTLGMLAGTAVAGIATVMLRRAGFALNEVHSNIFTLAATVELTGMLLGVAAFLRMRKTRAAMATEAV